MKMYTGLMLVLVLAMGSVASAGLVIGHDFNGAAAINASGVVPDVAVNPADGLLRAGAVIMAGAGPDGSDALHVNANGYGSYSPFAAKFDSIAGQPNMTMAYWIKTSAGVGNAWQATAAYGGGSGGPRMFNHWGLGSLGAISLDGGDTWNPANFGPGDPPGPGGTWHHVAMVLDNSNLIGYWDGVAAPAIVRAGLNILSNAGEPFTVGGLTDSDGADGGNGSPTLTLYDDAAMWKGAATGNQIMALYNGTESITSVNIPEPATMALLGLGSLAAWRRRKRN